MLNRATEFINLVLNEYLTKKNNLNIIDATVGNGKDALKILNLIDNSSFLTGFDIQKKAIEETEKLLKSKSYNNYKLINDGHEKFLNYFDSNSIDLIIYNLGYLPKSDKLVSTKWNTTLESLNSALEILKKSGLIIIVTYPGYDEGLNEHLKIEAYLKNLNQKSYNVFYGNFINQKNNPPNLFMVEKR